jgi:hypothetical protein
MFLNSYLHRVLVALSIRLLSTLSLLINLFAKGRTFWKPKSSCFLHSCDCVLCGKYKCNRGSGVNIEVIYRLWWKKRNIGISHHVSLCAQMKFNYPKFHWGSRCLDWINDSCSCSHKSTPSSVQTTTTKKKPSPQVFKTHWTPLLCLYFLFLLPLSSFSGLGCLGLIPNLQYRLQTPKKGFPPFVLSPLPVHRKLARRMAYPKNYILGSLPYPHWSQLSLGWWNSL